MIINNSKVRLAGSVSINPLAPSVTEAATVEGADYLDAVISEGGTVSQIVMTAIDLTFDEWRAEPGGDASVLSRIDHLWVPASETMAGANVALIYNTGDQILTQSGSGTPTYTPSDGFTFDGSMGMVVPNLNETTIANNVTRTPNGQYHTIMLYLMSKTSANGNYIYVDNTQNDLSLSDNTSGTNLIFGWSQGNNSTRVYPTLPAFIEVGNSRDFAGNNFCHWRVNGSVVATQGRTNFFHVAKSTNDYMWGGRNTNTPQYDGPMTIGAVGVGQEWYQSSGAATALNAEYQRQAVLLNTGIQRIMTALGR